MDGAAAMFGRDKASRSLGMSVVELDPGHAVLEMTVTGQMVNGHGIAHGGFVFLLADSAFAGACNYPGAVTVAASAEIVFVSAAREGERLTATATERHRAGRSGIYDVTVRCGERLVAEFRGLSRTLST
ncbi:hydroxyphenylacetyl-CoA thioesterase PaaI [Asanoa sp. NPDC049518]|uniref:hydroxyphenylacetyl-CoA thioesterase PaaI n=1 Tax=unclassified Asanoa TaxID=2685164 RepID=UPI00343EB5FF